MNSFNLRSNIVHFISICVVSLVFSMNLVQISGASTISSGHFVTSNKSDTILYNSEKGLEIQSISDKDIKRIDILSKSKKIMSFTRINETLYLNSLKTGSYSLIVELKNGEVIKRKLVKP